jgi:hypothetical protein
MKITLLNSKFEYRLDDKKTLVNVSETYIKNLVIQSLIDDSDGVSGIKCPSTDESLYIVCTEKLKKQFQPEYNNQDGYTEKEIELEDNFIEFERCDSCNEGFPIIEMNFDDVNEVYLCKNCS